LRRLVVVANGGRTLALLVLPARATVDLGPVDFLPGGL
jgi:hypothetical protein